MASSRNALKRLLRWCKISRDSVDANDFPIGQVTYLGKTGNAVMWFPYGFHANVPAEELALLLSIQGNPEARVALPGSPLKRVKVAAGEVVVFHPPSGSKIHFKANGDIDVMSTRDVNVTATGDVSVTAGGDATVEATGDTTVKGANVKLDATTLIEAALGATQKLMDETMIPIFNAHKHSSGGNPPTTILAVDTNTTTKLRGS